MKRYLSWGPTSATTGRMALGIGDPERTEAALRGIAGERLTTMAYPLGR
jgi:hypothetical protein